MPSAIDVYALVLAKPLITLTVVTLLFGIGMITLNMQDKGVFGKTILLLLLLLVSSHYFYIT